MGARTWTSSSSEKRMTAISTSRPCTSPPRGAYLVEVRDGGPDAHYRAMIASYDETLAAFETWMATRERLPQVDWTLIDM